MRYLELQNVSKSFGKVAAVSNVSLHVDQGEVLGFLGDNGAGKSTTIRLIAGVHTPDTGEILVKGKRVSPWNVAAARRCGIETVFQDRALAEQQTIPTNLFMGREPTRFWGFLDVQRQRQETEKLMRQIGFTSQAFSMHSPVLTLSGGERQGIAIARAMHFKAELLILDEPTAALSLTECEKVFSLVRAIRQQGRSCIFISHNIYHAYDVCDRFVILDRGTVSFELRKDETTAQQLIERMQDVARQSSRHPGAGELGGARSGA